MSLLEIERNPAFRDVVRATGQGEVWTHTRHDLKFNQFGWRCTNKESSYSNDILNGNWNEERCNYDKALRNRPLPSQHGHYYETTSYDSYSKPAPKVGFENGKEKKRWRRLAGRICRAYPGHQPEFDSAETREFCNSFITTSRTDYIDPKFRKEPLGTDVPIASSK